MSSYVSSTEKMICVSSSSGIESIRRTGQKYFGATALVRRSTRSRPALPNRLA